MEQCEERIWNKEKPKVDGHYWFRTAQMQHAKMIFIKKGIFEAGVWILEAGNMETAEFIGPIEV